MLHRSIKWDNFENGSEPETTPTSPSSAATSMRLPTSHRSASCPARSARLTPKRPPSRRRKNPAVVLLIQSGSALIDVSITSGSQNRLKSALQVFALISPLRTAPLSGLQITWASGRIWSWLDGRTDQTKLHRVNSPVLSSPKRYDELKNRKGGPDRNQARVSLEGRSYESRRSNCPDRTDRYPQLVFCLVAGRSRCRENWFSQ